MFLIDYPYVSEYLIRTLERNQYPVLRTPEAEELLAGRCVWFLSRGEAEQRLRDNPLQPIYSNAENALSHLSGWESWLPGAASAIFGKDKAAYREHTSHIYPHFFFTRIPLSQLEEAEHLDLPYPCVIKPSVGFFSLGVHVVEHRDMWPEVCGQIRGEQKLIEHSYPSSVVSSAEFIIEQAIDGEEYAVDAYYDEAGEPVILGIFKHLFSSASDVSDRVYVTSRTLRRQMHERCLSTLKALNSEHSQRLFPFHAELRDSQEHGMIPIEINPLRFGGWCTTADINAFATGIQQYEAFMSQQKPDILQGPPGAEDDHFSVIVLDNTTGYAAEDIAEFAPGALFRGQSTLLEFRPVDVARHGVFGFAFVQTPPGAADELNMLLHHNLRSCVTLG
ncbi:MAG: ATP-grasp domain-containing protein [Spirochaetota bacterium]